MPADIREYLMERFRSDAETLRERVQLLQAQSKQPGAPPVPGPDVALSAAMADACDHVVQLSTTLPEHASLEEIVASLHAMLPVLSAHGTAASANVPAAVRSVYAGAATRVLELIAAETRDAAGDNGQHTPDNTNDEDDE